MGFYDFDKDFKVGSAVEIEVLHYFKPQYIDIRRSNQAELPFFDLISDRTGKKWEVKFDILSKDTGNWAIEVSGPKGMSGIMKSTATWYVIVDDKNYYVMDKNELKRFILTYGRFVKGGDNKKSGMYLVKRENVIKNINVQTIKRLMVAQISGQQ
jgi:hypothetical protein